MSFPEAPTADVKEGPSDDDDDDEDTTTTSLVEVASSSSSSPKLEEAEGDKDMSQLIQYLDETNSCHKLRSLCKRGDTAQLRIFLELKPSELDIDYLSEEGWSCLHEIITHECQFVEVARILIEFGASVNTQDIHGDSPLHSSLLYHNVPSVKLLLKHGADLNLVNVGGRYPVHVADDVETLELIMDKMSSPADCQDALGYTPLHFAVMSKDLPRVNLLLKYSVDCNIQNHSGSTPLHLTNGDIEITSLLLHHSGDPNIPDMNANTPLHLATRGRHKDIVRLMIAKNGDPTLKNVHRKTPINLAKDKEMKQIINGSSQSPSVLPTGPTSSSGNKKTMTPKPSIIDKKLLPDIPSTPGILKRKCHSEDHTPLVRKGPRLTFSPVIDYNSVDSSTNEKRVKVPPIYIEPSFSSDEEC